MIYVCNTYGLSTKVGKLFFFSLQNYLGEAMVHTSFVTILLKISPLLQSMQHATY
jgi:hypothetical protein